MAYFKPDIYQKSIFDINYDKLYKSGIRYLIFDLDNTLALLDEKECPANVKKLIMKLKKKFKVVMISNNVFSRIKPYRDELEIDSVCLALKPLTRGLRRIKRLYKCNKNEMIMIGDQIVTDILSGKLFGISTCLVEPLSDKDLKITGFNREVENIILNKYTKKGLFERGKYYE